MDFVTRALALVTALLLLMFLFVGPAVRDALGSAVTDGVALVTVLLLAWTARRVHRLAERAGNAATAINFRVGLAAGSIFVGVAAFIAFVHEDGDRVAAIMFAVGLGIICAAFWLRRRDRTREDES